jgi:alkanesulfonate monooxygenase SsuD/methylene tetrahydromethanopterin reductase-like flavin-dependent oxidoreductase (luciferase family)
VSGPLFGVLMPQLRMGFGTIAERALAAEDLGFHSVWLMDHLAAPAAPDADTLEGWTTASALAARTARIRLGHLVLCGAFRHPSLLAKMAATLDVISDGRLELGIGWGSVPAEIKAFGFGELPARERASRLSETLEILEAMFSGEPVSYEGSHYRLEGAIGRPRPVSGRVPVHIGGAGPLTLALAARFGDWWNCPSYAAERLGELLPQAGSARASVQHPVGLAPSARARDETVRLAERRFGSWGGLLAGTPEEVAGRLSEEARMGAELFIVQFSDFGRPETLRLFAEEVAPAVTAGS